MIYRYRIALRPLAASEGGGWLAEVPELPGVMFDGDTPTQALDNVMDAIACSDRSRRGRRSAGAGSDRSRRRREPRVRLSDSGIGPGQF